MLNKCFTHEIVIDQTAKKNTITQQHKKTAIAERPEKKVLFLRNRCKGKLNNNNVIFN